MTSNPFGSVRLAPRAFVAVLVALTLGVSLAACGGSGNGQQNSDAASGPIKKKSAYLISCFDANAWCKAFNEKYIADMSKGGVKVTLLQNGFDPVEESQQFDQAISQRPGAIAVFAADGNAVVPSIKRARAAGIPVINVVAPISEKVKSDLALNLVEDASTNGVTLADYTKKALNGRGLKKANILVLNGVGTQYQMIAQWGSFKKKLKTEPDYKVVEMVDAQYDQAKAETLATQIFAKWQSRGGIDAVVAANDAMLAGAVEAANKLNIKIGGGDGLTMLGGGCFPIGYENIKAGKQLASLDTTPVPEAVLYAKASLQLFDGKSETNEVTRKSSIVDKANLGTVGQACLY